MQNYCQMYSTFIVAISSYHMPTNTRRKYLYLPVAIEAKGSIINPAAYILETHWSGHCTQITSMSLLGVAHNSVYCKIKAEMDVSLFISAYYNSPAAQYRVFMNNSFILAKVPQWKCDILWSVQ